MTATVMNRKISIRRSDAPIGAEIAGVDLSQELDDGTFKQVREAYYRYSVIVVRDQKLTPRPQVGFTPLRRAGDSRPQAIPVTRASRNPCGLEYRRERQADRSR